MGYSDVEIRHGWSHALTKPAEAELRILRDKFMARGRRERQEPRRARNAKRPSCGGQARTVAVQSGLRPRNAKSGGVAGRGSVLENKKADLSPRLDAPSTLGGPIL